MKTTKNKYEYQQELVEAAYTGEDICNYLWKFERESDWTNRVKNSFYVNFFNSIVDSMVVPVLSETPKRTFNNVILDGFMTDVDNKGTSMSEFVYDALIEYTKQNQVYIIVDNFEETSTDLNETIRTRTYPYLQMKKAYELHDFAEDRFGNIRWIEFYNGEESIKCPTTGAYKTQKTYVYIDDTQIIHRYYENSAIKEISVKEHNLGKVPVITINPKINPYPTAFDAANTCVSIYNGLSEQRDLERAQAFCILEIPMDQPEENVELGSKNIIYVPTDSARGSQYLSPDANVLKVLKESAKGTVDLLIQQADVLGTTASTTTNSSGVALGYKFMGKNYELKMLSLIAEMLETTIVECVATYFGDTALDWTYTVEYIREFAPSIDEINTRITTIKEMIALNISPEITQELKIELMNLLSILFKMDEDKVELLKGTIKIAEVASPVGEPTVDPTEPIID